MLEEIKESQDTDLLENEIYYSKALGKKVETLGDKMLISKLQNSGASASRIISF